MTREQGLELYTSTATAAAAPVIRRYSNSFRLATSLFPARSRADIRSIYALVRVADEIVDGTAAQAGLDLADQRARLDELETETHRAIASGFSANLVVHAFAVVARRASIPAEPVTAFFASMRRDLDDVDFDEDEYRTYIHGSAEAVGLMCLYVFLIDHPSDPRRFNEVEQGAIRLGAAFQKVNFLRDLGHDADSLGRAYFPGIARGRIDEAGKAAIIAEIRADLDAARRATAGLPRDCRRAVRVATDIFGALLKRIERTPAERLSRERVSVPAATKALIALRWTVAPWYGA